MAYFQGVVEEYLRANRATFINPEFLLQLEPGKAPPKGTSWWVDIMAVDFGEQVAFLCEVTYSEDAKALLEKLANWGSRWTAIQAAVRRDAHVSDSWPIRPWIFVPEPRVESLVATLPSLPAKPRITTLEMTLPWNYPWDRHGEASKPPVIPPEMV